MRFRLIHVLALLAIVAGAYAGVARALDFDDEDPEPPTAEVGLVYDYKIGTHAGCLPHRLSIGQGELPPGLKLTQLNDHTGLVSGVATEPGIFSAWIFLQDCAGKSAETLFRFEVWVRRWGITTTSLTPATAGSPYSFTFEGKGVPSDVTWEITSGALPPGLILSKVGTISGTPTAAGSATFTVKATAAGTDPASEGTRIDSREFTLNVIAPLAGSLSRRVAEVGVPVHSAFVATGGQSPYTWSAKGATPAGLSVGPDGSITGVPRRRGSYPLTAHLVDANGAARDVQVRLVVRPHVSIATRTLPPGTAGQAYRVRAATLGGAGGLQWSIAGGALPRGLRLGAATGTISGVPATAGTFRITLRVRDALGGAATKRLVLSIR